MERRWRICNTKGNVAVSVRLLSTKVGFYGPTYGARSDCASPVPEMSKFQDVSLNDSMWRGDGGFAIRMEMLQFLSGC